ncbi:MAG: hypothetical protein KAX44_06935 [Candidatus Brocadiae bacterium]|nr:hypothetical protein [Candidatus Brocadiia bacterium]
MNPDERKNALKCVAGEGLSGTGMGLLGSVSVLPLLFSALGATEVEVGLLGSIFMAGWLLLQPLSLFLLGRRRRTKRFLLPWGFFCAVPTYLGAGAAVYFLGTGRPRLCGVVVLVLLAVRVLGGGMAMPFWLDWQAMVFRRDIRGRVIGMMVGAFTLGGALAALVAGRAVECLSFPSNYSLLFLIASLFFVVSLGSFWMVREPDSLSAPYIPLKTADLFRRFARSLSDRNFRSYLIGRVLMTLGAGGAAFYAVHFKAAAGGGVAAATVIKLSSLLFLAQCAVSYPLGRLGDRAGHKVGVVVGAVAQVGAISVAYLGRGAVACGVTFALVGISWAAVWISHVNMLFETCPHDSRVAHITLSSMVLGPVLVLVPVGTGLLMRHVGMGPGIGLTLIPTLLGVGWLALMVKEPRDIELGGRDFDAPATA